MMWKSEISLYITDKNPQLNMTNEAPRLEITYFDLTNS